MLEIILGTGVAAFIVYAAFSIAYYVSMKRTSDAIRVFVESSGGNVSAALSELRSTLENIRKITSNVSVVTEDVRRISGSIASLEKEIRDLYDYLKASVSVAAEANMAGLKAGIATGVSTLVKNLNERKE
jgi:phage-related tail protein